MSKPYISYPTPERYGPQWAELSLLTRDIWDLPQTTIDRLNSLRDDLPRTRALLRVQVALNPARRAHMFRVQLARMRRDIWPTQGATASDVASSARLGLLMRDVISTEDYDALTLPWRTNVGSIFPGEA